MIRRGPNVTPEQKAEEITMYKAGNSCRDIADSTGRSLRAVGQRLKAAGVTRPLNEAIQLAYAAGKKIKATPENARAAQRMIKRGVMKKDIRKKLNISSFTLRKLEAMTNTRSPRKTTRREQVDTRIPYELFKKMRDQGRANVN